MIVKDNHDSGKFSLTYYKNEETRIMNKYLIIGGDHHNTLGLIESIAEKEIRPYVIILDNVRHSYIKHSNAYAKFWLFSNPKDIVKCMKKEFDAEAEKIVVISASDNVSCLLDNHYNELCDKFVLPLCKKEGDLNHWISKDKMGNLAKEVGLTIPEKFIIKNGVIPDGSIFPCITKAISSVEGSKDNIAICQNEEELRHFLDVKKHCSTIVAQRFIDKSYEFQLMGFSLNNGDDVVITGRTHIDRPRGIDNTFFLRFQECEPEFNDTIKKCKEFIKIVGYQGPFSIEFLKGKDGNNYFMEMNFRNDGNAICETVAGVNVPYIWYLYGAGGDWKNELDNSKIHSMYLIPEIQQVKFWLQGEVYFKELIRDFKRADKWITYFKNDKKPFFWFFIDKIRNRL